MPSWEERIANEKWLARQRAGIVNAHDSLILEEPMSTNSTPSVEGAFQILLQSLGVCTRHEPDPNMLVNDVAERVTVRETGKGKAPVHFCKHCRVLYAGEVL